MSKQYILLYQMPFMDSTKITIKEIELETDQESLTMADTYQAAVAFIFQNPRKTSLEEFLLGSSMNTIYDYANGASYQVFKASTTSAVCESKKSVSRAGTIAAHDVKSFIDKLRGNVSERSYKYYLTCESAIAYA